MADGEGNKCEASCTDAVFNARFLTRLALDEEGNSIFLIRWYRYDEESPFVACAEFLEVQDDDDELVASWGFSRETIR